jgi:tRNA A37 threonylcarbamoyladenosine dehydratase
MSSPDRFNRIALLIGEVGLARLGQASVAVFGLGGVGSYAVEALVRGGVGRLTLIDFDQVDITNCNRQIHAHDGTIGHPKALVMAERCRSINPGVQVEPLQAFYSQETSEELLQRGYDYVLDCIDHITAKLHLIETCVKTVYSTELFRPLTAGRRDGETEASGSYQFQRAPLGSSSVIPPLFGLTMAGEVIRELLERD